MLNAVFAAFSSANGILIWLAYLALFVAQKLFEKKKLLRADNVFVLAVGVVTWWLFFQGWSKLALANLHTESVYAFINTFIRFIANPFFEIQDTQTAYWVGLAILICACAMIVTVCLKKRVTEYAFPLLMLMFFFGSMIVIAYGRGSSELNGHLVASASQYATTPAWALVGVYLLLAQGVLANFQFQCKLTGFCKAVVPAAIYAALLSVSLDKYTIAEDFLTRMQADAYIVQHWDGAPDIAKTTYVFPFSKLNNNTMTELVDWLKENRLFLFKHEKDYQYPYNDYINNIQEEIVLPSQRTEPGNYHVDMVNDKEYEDGMSIVLGKSDWMHILGWALDETHEACPAAVYITVDDTYYSVTTIKREDVAVAYGNEAYSYSGIESWIPMKDLEPGKHDVELTVLSADSKSYYVAAILSIEISDSESLAGE